MSLEFIRMTVRGTKRLVHLYTPLMNGEAKAKINVGKQTVSGTVKTNKIGVRRFVPSGKNASLI